MNWQPMDTAPKTGRIIVAAVSPDEPDSWFWCEAYWGYSLFGCAKWCSEASHRPLTFKPTHWFRPEPPHD